MAIIPGEFGENIVIDTPQRRKTKKLIVIFIIIMLFTAAVIYFGFFSGSGDVPIDQAGAPGQIDPSTMGAVNERNKLLDSLREINLDNPVFRDKKFQSLILSDGLPVVIGEKGREDPFVPF